MYRFWTVSVLRYVALFFMVAVLVAAYFYPGGNIHDPAQPGYSITHNFLSDLGAYESHSGATNFVSAFLFNVAMFLFLGVGVGFCFVPRLFKHDPLNYKLALVGSGFFFIGTAFFAGVGLTPHDLYWNLHIFFALNAFRFLVPGALAYVVVLLRSPVNNRYSLVTLFYLVATLTYVIYQLLDGSPRDSMEELGRQATIQKMIAVISVSAIFSLSYAFAQQLRYVTRTEVPTTSVQFR